MSRLKDEELRVGRRFGLRLRDVLRRWIGLRLRLYERELRRAFFLDNLRRERERERELVRRGERERECDLDRDLDRVRERDFVEAECVLELAECRRCRRWRLDEVDLDFDLDERSFFVWVLEKNGWCSWTTLVGTFFKHTKFKNPMSPLSAYHTKTNLWQTWKIKKAIFILKKKN